MFYECVFDENYAIQTPLTLEATKAASSLCLNALSSCNTSLKIDQKSFIQSNFNGSNIFGPIENCSRHG